MIPMEEIAVEQKHGDIQMVEIQPDRSRLLSDSRALFGSCSIQDLERVRRFILRRCSEGGQLTHDQFLRFYTQVDSLDSCGYINTWFRINGDEKIRVTDRGLTYLGILDRRLGEETDCKEDGEPILRSFDSMIDLVIRGFHE